MSASFSFKVPQVLDFCVLDEHEDKKKTESYFDYDHENPNNSNDYFEEDNDMFFSPRDFKSAEGSNSEDRNGMRKSLSMSSLPIDKHQKLNDLCSQMENASLNSHKKNKNGQILGSSNSLYGRRSNSKEVLCKSGKIYTSMAEEINNFYRRTPERFHSKPKGWQVHLKPAAIKDTRTIPQSPAFSKIRKRPVTAIPYEEKQKLEFEEAQRHQVKARPVNKKILEGPQQIKVVPKKGPTKFEPFKLSENHKPKVLVVQDQQKQEFHAKPVPKTIYEPKPLPKKLQQITQPLTPKFVRKYTEKIKEAQAHLEKDKTDKGKENKPDNKTRTRQVPFSFDKRVSCYMKKREELIKKVIEEEKKKTEFHAKPMPKLYMNRNKGSMESVQSAESNKSDEQPPITVEFKARPAKVLNKEPFMPKKPERPHIEFDEFNLATTRRAREREEFEKKLKEKEEYCEQLRREMEERNKLKEEEEIARMRKQIEYVAKPIRHYKEVPKIEPKPLTNPCTPKLATAKLRRGNTSRDSTP